MLRKMILLKSTPRPPPAGENERATNALKGRVLSPALAGARGWIFYK